jgi:hypothetical protein
MLALRRSTLYVVMVFAKDPQSEGYLKSHWQMLFWPVRRLVRIRTMNITLIAIAIKFLDKALIPSARPLTTRRPSLGTRRRICGALSVHSEFATFGQTLFRIFLICRHLRFCLPRRSEEEDLLDMLDVGSADHLRRVSLP